MPRTLTVPYPNHGAIHTETKAGPKRNLITAPSIDYTVQGDDFTGDALRAWYPGSKTNGASASVTFTEHNSLKFLELVSGTDDDGYAGQGVGMQYTGDRGVLAQFIVTTPAAITTMKVEVGVSDNDQDAGAVNQKATTTTATATDFAVAILDTDDDSNWAFVSAKGGTVVVTQDLLAVAVSTTYVIEIRVEGDNVELWIDGTKLAGHGSNTGIEGGTDLTPWVFCQARAGSASRTLQWRKWQTAMPAY